MFTDLHEIHEHFARLVVHVPSQDGYIVRDATEGLERWAEHGKLWRKRNREAYNIGRRKGPRPRTWTVEKQRASVRRRNNERYRTDPEYREQMKTKARERQRKARERARNQVSR